MTVNASYFAGGSGYTPADMMQRDGDWIYPGVLSSSDLVVAQTTTASMAVTVSGASQGTVGGNAWLPGGYRVYNDSQSTLSIATADTTNPRIDLVLVGIDTTVNPYVPQLKVITGTPAASPSVPSYPTGFIGISLAKIAVAANATSIVTANITDLRVIAGMNTNALSDQVLQAAGGTATALTVPMQTLTNGYRKAFIAASNNGGVATTLNGLPFYKPGGTSAPTLIAGKAYEAWYNVATPCFFIKASAEGTASAANVLAPYTFSNDSDTGIVGSMPSKTAASYNPSTSTQTISSGQYLSGTQTINPVTGTANVAQVLSGYTFASANGISLTGTIPVANPDYADQRLCTNTALGVDSGDGVNYAYMGVPNGSYLNGVNWVRSAQPQLLAQNIVSGVNIFGVAGSAITAGAVSGTTTTGVAANNTPHNVTVNVGFQPRAVLIYNSYSTSNTLNNFAMTDLGLNIKNSSTVYLTTLTITSTVFTASDSWNRPGGDTINYICFK
jgi:hypothetical protein